MIANTMRVMNAIPKITTREIRALVLRRPGDVVSDGEGQSDGPELIPDGEESSTVASARIGKDKSINDSALSDVQDLNARISEK
jgi:hypothetical protein